MTDAHGDPPPAPPDSAAISRRRFLTSVGAGVGAAAAVGGLGGYALATEKDDRSPGAGDLVVPFHGRHQAGIVTPAPAHMAFASFDVMPTVDRDELRAMLASWTAAAASMCAGEPIGATDDGPRLAPPVDTGEAVGLPAAGLTVTFGVGPSLFTGELGRRLGLRDRRPAELIDIPSFPGDVLHPGRSDGDLGIQVCAEDPQVVIHAVRNLVRIGRGTVLSRWIQQGFLPASHDETPRNLMGFKDGTNNPKLSDATAMDATVWVPDDEPQAWMRGGTYLVFRRIRILVEFWDRTNLDEQERTIGRHKGTGAPMGADAEFDPLPLDAKDSDGEPAIPIDAHVRLAAASENGGAAFLRRGYSFTDGLDPVTGEIDGGLLFIAMQRDPEEQFVRVQRSLAGVDALNEYIKHVGSAIFAVPGGVAPGGSVGDLLLA
ncbi:MAG TPA: iron uptake transporter deferrochelatase/peroxidase subunit [Actinomycetota bacterium]